MARARTEARIAEVAVRAFRVPTDAPEADGTFAWDSTTMVLVSITAGDKTGLGYTYASAATGAFIVEKLVPVLSGRDAMAIPAAFAAMVDAIRNEGRPGVASTAISAVDNALWDLKAKHLDVSLAALLGEVRGQIPLYGSGGFTSYDDARLADQLGGWAAEGFPFVKMKIGTEPDRDPVRVAVAREAIGPDCALFVDANGAFTAPEARRMADRLAEWNVRWFEEPVSSDDLGSLAAVKNHAPAGMAIAAGEYGYDLRYFRHMLEADAVDVLQADATRCGGITGFMEAAAVAHAFGVPFSAHCAPSLHVPACCALAHAEHIEWFHDHARIEHLLFDGAPKPEAGHAEPSDAPGFGLVLRPQDAARYEI